MPIGQTTEVVGLSGEGKMQTCAPHLNPSIYTLMGDPLRGRLSASTPPAPFAAFALAPSPLFCFLFAPLIFLGLKCD